MANENDEAIAAARAVLDDFMTALNAEDEAAIRTRWFHFPHVRLHSGKVLVMNTAADYRSPVLSRQGQASEWARSAWDYAEPIDAGADKVHFRVQFSRYRADGSLIGRYKSLYIVTFKDGRWGIQARSTWAE
jgi:hypothetical protein